MGAVPSDAGRTAAGAELDGLLNPVAARQREREARSEAVARAV
jgi:hypothetical protein